MNISNAINSVSVYKCLILIGALLLASHDLVAQAIKVEVRPTSTGYTLIRDGKPYYLRGVGGQVQLEKAVEIGANSIRTWSLERAKEYLDNAQKHGLTVTMGLWVQHERHGFDYNNEAAVKKQLDYFTAKVKELKDHPALLMWGIGNEVDLMYTNTKVWDAVQDIAEMIHREDPNHPTTTVTAGLHKREVQLVKSKAPDIDIFGVNTYGELKKAVDSIKPYGWDGPFLIAEWGPNGHWEVAKTSWGAPIEQSSSSKAESYAQRYQYIANNAKCIGSYVFLWGHKQETTSTWYGLFTENGNPTEPIDELYKAWRNGNPPDACPKIKDYQIKGTTADSIGEYRLIPGERYEAMAVFSDPENKALNIKWKIVSESTDIRIGGDAEKAPPAIPGLVKRTQGNKVTFKAPSREGPYRLFVTAIDKGGNAAYVNMPFYVLPGMGQAQKVKLKKRELIHEYR
jgi:hypothetical protein